MKFIIETPKLALKAFLKQKPPTLARDIFKANLITLLDKIRVIDNQVQDESEEHLKNNLRDFLRDTYYKEHNAINTKDKKDLVIHAGKTTSTDVAVIIEAKRPSNVREMVSAENANKKALHELILYYFNERNEKGNIELKQLVITDIFQWFIIDANFFDKHIYRNNQIKKLYEVKLNDKKDNPWFYEEISKILGSINLEIPCVYFDIRKYDKIIRNNNTEDDRELVALYKILSPEHLLKVATLNDSNSLNEQFYRELLHIMGLEEATEGSKNIIRRKKENRDSASLIELTIDAFETAISLPNRPEFIAYGNSKEEQTFNIAFELCITWINRILFLKLLEGQLVSYHSSDKNYRFLHTEFIPDYNELFKLFHKVLAVTIAERSEAVKSKFKYVPYLNSSLFEISELEDQTIKINSLDNRLELLLLSGTVLSQTKATKKKLPSIQYLFSFLDAYDFASEGNDDWQKDNKQLINASVLGKVFEKINGYRDGSIFTPAYITMYMCRESIRLAVLDKFNDTLSKDGEKMFDTIEDLKNYTATKHRTTEVLSTNSIINSLHICDPAVGSGHFLVSALNELIAIKAELGILADDKGVKIIGYEIHVINDELVITDQEGTIVEYKIQNGKSVNAKIQTLQKTLFHEKQSIIENCLFGVDINPKSVLICRLRLWIELLKNAYYIDDNYENLETLPNIDINIKCGNSLLSRFALDADLTQALKSIRYDINTYRGYVNSYKNEKNREVKHELQKFINDIKTNFRTKIFNTNPLKIQLNDVSGELYNLMNSTKLFADSEEQKIANNERKEKLENEIVLLNQQVDELNELYKSAFEWRFEFPEVLNDNGDFAGFDIVIGNPPYIKEYENKSAFNGLRTLPCYQGKMDIWYLFGQLGLSLSKTNGYITYIATNNWVTNSGASKFRNRMIANSQIISLIDFGDHMVFESAAIQTMIMLFRNNSGIDNYTFDYRRLEGAKPGMKNALKLLGGGIAEKSILLRPVLSKEQYHDNLLTFSSEVNETLLDKIKAKHNFFLYEKADKKNNIKSELGQGIVAPQDFVNNASFEKLNSTRIHKRAGIFVLTQDEFEIKDFSESEKKIIKPYYTTEQLKKYNGNKINTHWLIYTKSNINKSINKTEKSLIDNYPKIKQHLEVFSSVITSDNKPFGLHRARMQYLFEGKKIIVTRKSVNEPIFTYTDFDCFVSQTFFVIKTDRINLKYLTGLLNSKLVAFWLRKKGKMQGNNFQLDKEPLLEIPIFKPLAKDANKIAGLVDKIISLKEAGKDSSKLEKEIDVLVYALYGLTEDEQTIIENQ